MVSVLFLPPPATSMLIPSPSSASSDPRSSSRRTRCTSEYTLCETPVTRSDDSAAVGLFPPGRFVLPLPLTLLPHSAVIFLHHWRAVPFDRLAVDQEISRLVAKLCQVCQCFSFPRLSAAHRGRLPLVFREHFLLEQVYFFPDIRSEVLCSLASASFHLRAP